MYINRKHLCRARVIQIPVTALASLVEDKVSGALLEVGVSTGALVEGIKVFLVTVQAVSFPPTEATAGQRSGGGGGHTAGGSSWQGWRTCCGR